MNSSFFDLEVIWTDRTEGVHVVAAVLTALLVISIDFGYTSTDWSGICLLQSLLLRFIAERI
jgi:general stress protein CsbA